MKNKGFYLPMLIGIAVTAVASTLMLRVNLVGALICAVTGAVLLCVFGVFTAKRYRAISELNDYLSLVCAGHYDLALGDNSEGELSILQNNLLKVISQLKTQNEVIAADKVYLADSLADISHQLKTPLTSMMMVSELLEDETDEDKRREFIGIIHTQCNKMNWLVQTLLKLSKLDAGTADMNREPLAVGEIIESALAPFMLTLDLKNINVEKKISDFQFTGDKNWSTEALQNIIKNCIEHTDAGGTLRIETDETTVFKRIVIRDNGCGIAREDLPHIFERFYHGKNASSESVGIGLALSKAILSKENASVSVTSEEGRGTQFEIKFYKSVI
ncbi:MAG: HAMP domain-containing histidine kinase [Ruminococcaceae bacterium]|nr:HAMP domain-containing histidine kinase [Oscillospiraceae bacterium]